MRGEVGTVRGLEVAQRRDGGRQVVTLPLQVTEQLPATTLDLPIELLRTTVGVGLQPLRIDPSFRLHPLGPRTSIRGELMSGPVGLLPDPVGVLGGLLNQPLGLLGRHLDQADHCGAGLLARGDHDRARLWLHRCSLGRCRLPWLGCLDCGSGRSYRLLRRRRRLQCLDLLF
jgi:hypothetical protein